MLVELDLRLLPYFSRKLVVVKNDIETLFSGNGLQNQGAHYTQVNSLTWKISLSRSFEEPWKKITKFQEFSRNPGVV